MDNAMLMRTIEPLTSQPTLSCEVAQTKILEVKIPEQIIGDFEKQCRERRALHMQTMDDAATNK